MSKQVELEGKEIASVLKIGKTEIIHFTDGTFIIVEVLSDVLNAEDLGLQLSTEVDDDDDSDDDDSDDDDSDDDDEITIDDMKEDLLEGKHVTKKKLKKMDDEAIGELWDEHCGEDDDEGSDDDGITADDINDSDYDDLEDMIDEEELEIDIEDFDDNDKDIKKLRKAVAKALKIKL